MKLKSSEKVMLAILLLLVYIFVLGFFVLKPFIPGIISKNIELVRLSRQKDSLDAQLKKINQKRDDVKNLKLNNERMEEYLSNEAGITDSIEYLEKLADIMGSDITNINISKPEVRSLSQNTGSTGGSDTSGKYYELGIEFNTRLYFGHVENLINYIEGGSRKVRVNSLKLISEKTQQNTTGKLKKGPDAKAVDPGLLNLTIDLSFFSLDSSTADKLFEYSKTKFSRYSSTVTPFVISTQVSDDVKTPPSASGKDSTLKNNELTLNIKSFLSAGDNLSLLSRGGSGNIRIATKERVTVDIKLTGDAYTANLTGNSGSKGSIHGIIPKTGMSVYISADVPSIKENELLGADLKVANNSGNPISFVLDDKSGRVKIMDRDGRAVSGKDERENIIIQ